MAERVYYFNAKLSKDFFMLVKYLQGVLGLKRNYELLRFLVEYYCRKEGIDLDRVKSFGNVERY